jgi:acylphosphatase
LPADFEGFRAMSEVDDRDLPPGWNSAQWLVSGRVQGVGFRYYVLQSAHRLGVFGDVRNLRDGRVEVRAQGPGDQVEGLLASVRRGPPGARVDLVETLELDKGLVFDTFTIR